jgi:hypothetical protein
VVTVAGAVLAGVAYLVAVRRRHGADRIVVPTARRDEIPVA